METRIRTFLEKAADSRTIEVVEMLLKEGAYFQWHSAFDSAMLYANGQYVMSIDFEDDDFSTSPSFDSLYFSK